jgi:hypothetical protein
MAHRSHHGVQNYEAEARRRILCGNRRCDNTIRHSARRNPGFHYTHHHRSHRGSGDYPPPLGCPLGCSAKDRMGVGSDDTCVCGGFSDYVPGNTAVPSGGLENIHPVRSSPRAKSQLQGSHGTTEVVPFPCDSLPIWMSGSRAGLAAPCYNFRVPAHDSK